MVVWKEGLTRVSVHRYVLQMVFFRIMNPVYILMPTQSEQPPAWGGSTLLV